MIITVPENSFFIFDLDDTLFPEISFLRSGFRAIANYLYPFLHKDIFQEMLELYDKRENVFVFIIENYKNKIDDITKDTLLNIYRYHFPDIKLEKSVFNFLQQLQQFQIPMGLITDGRSITQRNKIEALGIQHFFSDIIISEEFGSGKPHPDNFLYFSNKYHGCDFYLFADNTTKDFIVPAQFGWKSFCLKGSKENIHKQNLDQLPESVSIFSSFDEIVLEKITLNVN
jgi:putative hydrolase of the HAD superfamily